MPDDECWDAFGSDSESEDEPATPSCNDERATAIALYLAQFFLVCDPKILLSDRVVGVADKAGSSQNALKKRGITTVHTDLTAMPKLDALILMDLDTKREKIPMDLLLPGGILISLQNFELDDKDYFEASQLLKFNHKSVVARIRRAGGVHASACPWLPTSHSLLQEQNHLQSATITPSSKECSQGTLSTTSVRKAVQNLSAYGYCIIRNFLDPSTCEKWGDIVLQSVHSAAEILRKRDRVDIFNPHTSECDPQAYREMSMREDLRLDIRHAPMLAALRSTEKDGNSPIVVTADTAEFDGFLRGNASILEIVRRSMNPTKADLFKGNLGRYNFGGRGADGSFQDLRLSPVGGIVSLPGCADQAIHADTPHLFEHVPDLPAHYINIFAPGTPFDEKVGGTAFVHGSHNLDFTAKNCGSRDDFKQIYPFLVRPSLTLGDVVLFDCRILHFGMANRSEAVERVLLYVNTTQAWFHDPKNWDDRKRIWE